jgi:DNA-binding HxlR family transcriptional regulator
VSGRRTSRSGLRWCSGRPLAARLRTLVAAGILERRPYSEHPARSEYHLTDAGRDLYPVILTLMRSGDQHLAGTLAPSRSMRTVQAERAQHRRRRHGDERVSEGYSDEPAL